MPIHYKTIPGWFLNTAEELYTFAFNKYKDQQSARFVEIGSYFGKSSCYMAELIKDSNISFDIIDPWQWDNLYDSYDTKIRSGQLLYGHKHLNTEHIRIIEEIGKDPYKITKHYFDKYNILSKEVRLIQERSENIVNSYEDNSIDFLYIDGDHTHDAVRRDIRLYLPKVKHGGIISGDDYINAVKPVVDEELGTVTLMGDRTWWKYKI